jgi:hypothetical protein
VEAFGNWIFLHTNKLVLAYEYQGPLRERSKYMKFFQLGFTKRSFATQSLVMLLAITAMALSAVAQKSSFRVLAPENVGYRLEQCANGGRSVPQVQDPCNTASEWVTGIVNNSKAHYREGDSVPYRLNITGLAPGVPTYVTFGWDTTKGGKHAIDYITSYDRTENASNPQGPTQAIPCAGIDPAICPIGNIAGDNSFPIPADPNYSGAIPAPNFPQETAGQSIKIWGGTIIGLARPAACGDDSSPIPDNVNPYLVCGTYAGDSSTGITVRFTPTGSEVLLAWGGHIAKRLDWGVNNGATSISGAPFHTGLITGGSRDVQMALNAVLLPGCCSNHQTSFHEQSCRTIVDIPVQLYVFSKLRVGVVLPCGRRWRTGSGHCCCSDNDLLRRG